MTEAMRANDTFNVGMRAEAAIPVRYRTSMFNVAVEPKSYYLGRPFCDFGLFSFHAILSYNHISKPVMIHGST